MIQRGQHVRHDFAIRDLTVSAVRELSPSFRRVTLTGADLAGFTSLGAGDHSKVFFPNPANGDYAVPALTGDGLRMPDAGTVIMRDYTPRAFRKLPAELDIDFYLHGDDGPASAWAARVSEGDRLVVAGPRGSHLPPAGAARVVLLGDETALPAIARWIETLPEAIEVFVFVELGNQSDAAYLDPDHVHRARVVWLGKGDGGLERAIRSLDPALIGDDTYFWGAGDSESLLPVRHYLRRELGLPVTQVKLTGYWKPGVEALDHHAPIDPTDPD